MSPLVQVATLAALVTAIPTAIGGVVFGPTGVIVGLAVAAVVLFGSLYWFGRRA